jgi:hypothetical protein
MPRPILAHKPIKGRCSVIIRILRRSSVQRAMAELQAIREASFRFPSATLNMGM